MSVETGHDANSFATCIEPLLAALRWRGTPRQRVEAIGPRVPRDLLDVRNALANLGYTSQIERKTLDTIDGRLLPCLFVGDDGRPMVVSGDHERAGRGEPAGTTGIACFFTLDVERNATQLPKTGWFHSVLDRFNGTMRQLWVLSLVLNLLALAPVFFTMTIYNHVLPARDANTLAFLALGVGLAILGDAFLRLVRGAALAHVGARLDFLVGSAAFRKLLSLPLARLESMTTGAHIARLRQFEGLRSAFVGPLALALLDLPFALVFVVALAFIGGWLALVPLLLAGALVGLGSVIIRATRRTTDSTASRLGDHQNVLVEIVSNMRAIKTGASEAIWLERFRERSAESAFAQLRQSRIAALTDNIAQEINLVAGASTLAIGALLAINGTISVGALIASMALVWRILAPLQTLFVMLNRLEDAFSAARAIDQLMMLPSEGNPDAARPAAARGRRFAGRISFQRTVLRYTLHHEPALAGVSFDIKPGEIVAVTGGNGSGKSSLLKLVANLYQAQGGCVLIDGVDTRQLNPIDLRQAIAYLPQQSDVITGSIADNLRLGQPAASEEALQVASAKAALLTEVEQLAQGFATPVGPSLSPLFLRKLALARTYLMDASIVLLDEPGAILDADGSDALLRQLDALRGRATVLLVTHRPEQVRAADRVLVLNHGLLVHDGPPQELMKKLAGDRR